MITVLNRLRREIYQLNYQKIIENELYIHHQAYQSTDTQKYELFMCDRDKTISHLHATHYIPLARCMSAISFLFAPFHFSSIPTRNMQTFRVQWSNEYLFFFLSLKLLLTISVLLRMKMGIHIHSRKNETIFLKMHYEHSFNRNVAWFFLCFSRKR